MDLLRSTVDGLLLGQALDAGAWRSLLYALTQHDQEDHSGLKHSLETLARMVIAEETRDLEVMAQTIPSDHQPVAAAAAVVASSRTLNAASAASLSELVFRSYALVSYVSEAELVKPVFQRLAVLQGRAIELGGEPLNLSAASMFTLLANTLAIAHGDPSHLERALALADRLPACPAGPARYIVANNLITTFKQLARYRPAEAERYLLGGLELVTGLYQTRHDFARMHPDPNSTRTRPVDLLKNLLFLRIELANLNPARAAEHVAAAWQDLARLQQFADELGDPDVRRDAIQAERYVRDHAGAAPGPSASHPADELPSAEEVVRRMDEAVSDALEAAHTMVGLPAGAPRHAAVAQHLERMYADLARALHPVIQELGINRHVSRVLLALGTVASGRLWPLSWPAVQPSMTHTLGQVSREGPIYLYEQEMASRGLFDLSLHYPSIVCAVAVFSDVLSSDAELAGVLREMLREQNRRLLEQLLPMAVQPQHVSDRQMSREGDLAEIAERIRHFGGRRAPRPPPESDARNPTPEPDGDPELSPPVDPGGPEGQFDFEQWLAPENLIGKVHTFQDVKRKTNRDIRIDSIVGQGTEKIVFGITYPDTGESSCLAMFRSSFGPRAVLRRYTDLISNGREVYNPQNMLAICNAGLAAHPGDLIFAFHKGLALTIKGDFAGASDALDVGLASAPDDLECLAYKANALSLLGHHASAVLHVARASRLHPDALRELLTRVAGLGGQLATSVNAVLQDDPRRLDAVDLMREYFSASSVTLKRRATGTLSLRAYPQGRASGG